MSGNLKLNTSLGGSIALAPENTASTITVTVPAVAGTILTTATAGVPIGGPAFSVYATGGQTVTASTFTKIQLNTEIFDTNSCFDNTTTYRFTPTVAGYYQVNGQASMTAGTTVSRVLAAIFKNGNAINYGNDTDVTNTLRGVVSSLVLMNGTTDYLELFVLANGIGALSTTSFGGTTDNYFTGCLVRSAT